MSYVYSLFVVFFVALSFLFFNSCAGVATKKQEFLGSLSGDLEVAPPPAAEKTEEEVVEELEETDKKEPPPPPEDPKEFNYFPYDLQLDALAYMTCESPTFFNFKSGAFFKRSGFRLSDYFLKKSEVMSDSELETLIKSSTKHKVHPYFTISAKHNRLSVNKSIPFGLSPLHRSISDLISAGSTRVQSLNGDTISVKITDPTRVISYAKALKTGSYQVVLNYRDSKHIIHKAGGDAGIDIYGRAYTLSFSEAISVAHLPRYVISSVSETKLPNNTPQTDWTCPESLKLEVRRHNDHSYKALDLYKSVVARDPAYRQQYDTLQKALNAPEGFRIAPDEGLCPTGRSSGVAHQVAQKILGSDWNINISEKCISLKKPSSWCYKMSTMGDLGIRLANKGSGNNCSGTSYSNYCPHFVSICVRKN